MAEDKAGEPDIEVHSFLGGIKPSDVHPKIADALLHQKVFNSPEIVQTEQGFHIIQRLAPLDFYLEK